MRYEITVDFKKKTLRIRSPLLGNNGLLFIINLYFNGRIWLMNHKNKALGRLICLLNLYIYIYIYICLLKKRAWRSSKELSTKAAIALNHAQLLPSATFRGKQVILNRAKIQVHLARLPQNWEEKDRGTEKYVDKSLSTRSLHSDIPRGGLFCHLELMQRWLL